MDTQQHRAHAKNTYLTMEHVSRFNNLKAKSDVYLTKEDFFRVAKKIGSVFGFEYTRASLEDQETFKNTVNDFTKVYQVMKSGIEKLKITEEELRKKQPKIENASESEIESEASVVKFNGEKIESIRHAIDLFDELSQRVTVLDVAVGDIHVSNKEKLDIFEATLLFGLEVATTLGCALYQYSHDWWCYSNADQTDPAVQAKMFASYAASSLAFLTIANFKNWYLLHKHWDSVSKLVTGTRNTIQAWFNGCRRRRADPIHNAVVEELSLHHEPFEVALDLSTGEPVHASPLDIAGFVDDSHGHLEPQASARSPNSGSGNLKRQANASGTKSNGHGASKIVKFEQGSDGVKTLFY
eukprot:936606_1